MPSANKKKNTHTQKQKNTGAHAHKFEQAIGSDYKNYNRQKHLNRICLHVIECVKLTDEYRTSSLTNCVMRSFQALSPPVASCLPIYICICQLRALHSEWMMD